MRRLALACAAAGLLACGDGAAQSPDAATPDGSAADGAPTDGAATTEGAAADAAPCVPLDDRFGVNIDPKNPGANPPGTDLAAAGARWARVEMKDLCDRNTPPAAYSFFDPVVTQLRAAGVRIVMIVDYSSVKGTPFHDRTEKAWDDYAIDFSTCAAELAQHYVSAPFGADTIGAFELWNEPDNPPNNGGYDPYVPPAAYGRMFNESADAMRAAMKSALGSAAALPVVMTGGLDAGSHSGYLQAAIQAVGALHSDATGVHEYGVRPDDTWPTPTWGFANLGDDLTTYEGIVKQPLWITEFGTEDLTIQAEYIRRTYARLAKDFASVVPHALVYAWSDAQGDAQHPWGLVDTQGKPKASYCAFREAALQVATCDGAPDGGTCP